MRDSLTHLRYSPPHTFSISGHTKSVREHTKSHPPRHDGDALSALLATELALREQFETARAEAEKIVADARMRAKTTESSLKAVTAAALAELGDAHEHAMRKELAQIRDVARADLARFEAVPDVRIREMAERVVALVLGA